jgi:hypothetical protein
MSTMDVTATGKDHCKMPPVGNRANGIGRMTARISPALRKAPAVLELPCNAASNAGEDQEIQI